jgi:hypothetical protein
MSTLAFDRLLTATAPTHARTDGTTPLADLLLEAGAVLDALAPERLEGGAATVDALASELALAARRPELVDSNPTLAASLRTIAHVAARTAGAPVAVDAEQAGLIRLVLAQL